MFHIWKCCVDFHCIESMQWLKPNRINRACCACFWASSLHQNWFISRLKAPCCRKQNMQAIGRSRPPTKASSSCRVRVDLSNHSRKGIQEAASPRGEATESKRSGWEGRAPTYIQNFSGSMHYLWAVVHNYTYKPSMKLFSWQWPEK